MLWNETHQQLINDMASGVKWHWLRRGGGVTNNARHTASWQFCTSILYTSVPLDETGIIVISFLRFLFISWISLFVNWEACRVWLSRCCLFQMINICHLEGFIFMQTNNKWMFFFSFTFQFENEAAGSTESWWRSHGTCQGSGPLGEKLKAHLSGD